MAAILFRAVTSAPIYFCHSRRLASHRLSEETGSDILTTIIVAAVLLAFLLLLLLLEGRDGNRMNEWIKEGGIYPDSLVSFGDRLVMSECTDDGRLLSDSAAPPVSNVMALFSRTKCRAATGSSPSQSPATTVEL